MVKQIIIGILVVILVGAVGVGIYDAFQGNSSFDMPDVDVTALIPGGQNGPGQGRGGGQGNQGQGNSANNSETISHDWVTLTGTVISADAQTLRVNTAELGEIDLMLGEAGFAQQQAVEFNPGDTVTVQGFESETGIFQAGQINNDTTGQVLMLRDPNGRPLWAGRGQGNQGQGQGGESGQPQAMANEWRTITGVVSSASARQLLIDTDELGQVMVQLGRPGFAEAQGIEFSVGDAVTVYGFSSQGQGFQAGQINNDTTGQVLMLRDPNGRPLWAGRGQGNQGHGQGQNSQQTY